jgi:hypothetical protein
MISNFRFSAVAALLLASICNSSAFSPRKTQGLTRRDAVGAAFGLSTLILNSKEAFAAAGPTNDELDRIKQGYDVSFVSTEQYSSFCVRGVPMPTLLSLILYNIITFL